MPMGGTRRRTCRLRQPRMSLLVCCQWRSTLPFCKVERLLRVSSRAQSNQALHCVGSQCVLDADEGYGYDLVIDHAGFNVVRDALGGVTCGEAADSLAGSDGLGMETER